MDIQSLAGQLTGPYRNTVIAEVNDHCVRLAVNENRTYDWHFHPDSDELFIGVEGVLTIEFENRAPVEISQGAFFTVAKGQVHRTVVRGRVVNLCVESTRARTVFTSDPSGVLNDDEFLAAFEDRTLAKEWWKHRTHVRMAWLYLRRHGFEDALKKVREGIQRYNEVQGKPGGYRETETQFFVRLIHHRMKNSPTDADFHQFCELHQDLFDGSNPPRKRYYSDALWRSPETWSDFVLPDLSPLPGD